MQSCADARKHLSFGLGRQFCVDSPVAEMQVLVLWEQVLKRFDRVEVVSALERVRSSSVGGISRLPVRLHAR